MVWIYLTFFLAGFPALIYQLVWQRSLFTFFGTNIESVTVVVTAFMLGLGIGSLLGGRISKYAKISPLLAFAFMEFGIAAFGIFSISLFDYVGAATAGSSAFTVFFIAFLLVLVPTLLMGATLPILTAYLVNKVSNVGRSVGVLYFVNTLGSASACFLAAIWLFASFGMSGVVNIAVILNIVVGTGALLLWLVNSRKTKIISNIAEVKQSEPHTTIIDFRLGLILAGSVGFIALSYEILWLRVIMFTSAGWALAFPIFLGFFLSGIAIGSYAARKFCRSGVIEFPKKHLKTLAWFLFCANLVGFSTIPILTQVITSGVAASVVFFVFVALSAAMFGAVLPLVAHYSVPADSNSGSKLSYLYMANIVGSAAGSLFTGFILLDNFSIGHVNTFLALLGLLLAFILFFSNRDSDSKNYGIVATAAVALLFVVLQPSLFNHVYERLQLKQGYNGEAFARVIENKSGVITVKEDGSVWGGGVYDGIFSTSLVDDKNGIVRAYSLFAVHDSPSRVLMIGLASGSWAQVVANNPAVEKLTIVDINEGYVSIISENSVVSSLLNNPKVEIIIDDGRRWLNANPNQMFDVIISNSTLHWRAYASNLLSQEYIELEMSHINPGGIVMYNGTCAPEVYKTAVETFPYALRFLSMAIGSNEPIQFNKERWRNTLENYKIDGQPVFDLNNGVHRSKLEAILSLPEQKAPGDAQASIYSSSDYCYDHQLALETKDVLLQNTRNYTKITDDNMGTEWHRQPWKDIVGNKATYNSQTAK